MNFDFLETIKQLKDRGDPFVIATVVRAEKPTSAKPGAKAVITADSQLTGWIGGSCAEPTVKREALKALEDGQPRLLRLCPPEQIGEASGDGVTEVPMTCISGGTLEIFIEPVLVQPQLIVAGHLAVAESLSSLATDLGFSVTVMGLEVSHERFPKADRVLDTLDFSQLEIRPSACIVVASHGNYDEEALTAALHTEAAYVALVTSKARAEAILQYLQGSNLSTEQIARLKYPAGLDIGAITPEEIALSILAEIVQFLRQNALTSQRLNVQTFKRLDATDPVCGMTVEIATARYTTIYEDQTYYFCAKSCQRSFEAAPHKYIDKEESHAI